MAFKSPTLHYLGSLCGRGVIMQEGRAVAEATFDIDGYSSAAGGVTGCGEIQMPREDLKRLFGHAGLQLLTEQGRRLDIRFSQTQTPPDSDVAHVDVAGDLPVDAGDWRH